MAARSGKVTFANRDGDELAGRLERPPGETVATALFAHCFTCSKDVAAASRIARALARRGIAVLRFDFTGLGNSAGDFANTSFSSNVDDLVAAADHLRETLEAPALLVGHSLGGAAVIAAASRIAEVEAVATVGAPSNPRHVRHLFDEDALRAIAEEGEATVRLAGREFRVGRALLDDLAQHSLAERLQAMRGKALLLFHSPVDDVVDVDHARRLYEAARHPKSFISLDRADHLLSRRPDSEFVAATLAAWASRYVCGEPGAETPTRPRLDPGQVVVAEVDGLRQRIWTAGHELVADEPESAGGSDAGPNPYELLLAALGACTAMTVRLYADRKQWPLEVVRVRLQHDRIHAEDCRDCETTTGKIDRIVRSVALDGELDDDQRARLVEIAGRCPVHRTLVSEKEIVTRLGDGTDT